MNGVSSHGRSSEATNMPIFNSAEFTLVCIMMVLPSLPSGKNAVEIQGAINPSPIDG
jgi:hypothetical protein